MTPPEKMGRWCMRAWRATLPPIWCRPVGDTDAAFAQAAHVVTGRYRMDRGAAHPMETRGIVAEWNDAEQSLTCWISTQGPIPIRNGLADALWFART